MTPTKRFSFAGKEYALSALPIANGLSVATAVRYGEAIDALRRAENQRDLLLATASATKSLGFDSFTYGCIVSRINTYPEIVVFTTLSKQWMVNYHQLGYADKDPRVLHILNNSEPLCWSLNDYGDDVTLTDMLADMEREGLCAGVAYPLHFRLNRMECAGMFSLNSGEKSFWSLRSAEKFDVIGKGYILASSLNQRLLDLRVITQRKVGDHEPHPELLTPREREMLELMYHGDTDRSVAQRLHVEHTTVRRHVDSVRAKLCARSKAEMLAIAREMGICGSSLSAFMQPPTKP